MSLQREPAAIDDQFGAFVDAGLDPVLDALLVRGVHHRAVMRVVVGRDADPERRDRGDQFLAQRIGGLVADRHHNRQRHAALARAAERRAAQFVDHLVEIGVGHDDAVVLGPAHRLHALSGGDAALVDVMRDVGRADEAHRRDGGMIEDRIDHFLVAVDDLQDALGRARLAEQFGEPHRHRRIALAGLEDEGIAARDAPGRTSTSGSSPGS